MDREAPVQHGRGPQDFDVFLCYHGIDKLAVKEIGEQLKKRGLLPWLDEWELRPGLPWQRLLEEQIEHIRAAAVFVGSNGVGPWQQLELEAFLREFVSRTCPVIPVLLLDAPGEPQLPVFLRGMTWVDFRKQIPEPIERLIWGITGVKSSAIRQVIASKDTSVKMPASSSVTSSQRRRLEQKSKMFQDEWNLLIRKVERIRRAWLIEYSPVMKFQLEQQLEDAKATLKHLESELDGVEQALQ